MTRKMTKTIQKEKLESSEIAYMCYIEAECKALTINILKMK